MRISLIRSLGLKFNLICDQCCQILDDDSGVNLDLAAVVDQINVDAVLISAPAKK